jgi:lipoyl(octanoyl) transferase
MRFENWGRINYQTAWDKQRALVDKRISSEIDDTIVFCEHDEVITLGRAAQRDILTKPDTQIFKVESANLPPVFEVERGGQATYHGPGQIVVYPIVKLLNTKSPDPFFSGVHGLIRTLEGLLCEFLSQEFKLNAKTVDGKTGVWIDSRRKIASLGISAKKWVSYHGLALNVATGTQVWGLINPCGFESSVMTDIQKETGSLYSYEFVADRLMGFLQRYFNRAHGTERLL